MIPVKRVVGVAVYLWLAMAVAWGASPGLKTLSGHVPGIVSRLTPEGVWPGTNRISLGIGVTLPNPASLQEFIGQLYNPGSPNFHKYLTPAEFTARFGPTEQDYAAVEKFAQASGLTITATHGSRLLLDVSGTADAVGKAFHVTLRRYHHPTENRDFYAPDTEPTVAADLPIADISGLNNYSRPHPNFHPRPKTAKPHDGSGPDGTYVGNDFRAAYVPGSGLNGAGQTVGLVQFDGFYSNDIVAYENLTGITNYVPLQTVLIDGSDGTPVSSDGNTEASLDIEMVLSMAPGVSSIVVFEGSQDNFMPNDVLTTMAESNTVQNLSSSWGWNGGPSTTTDTIFLQMAAQGQTYFNAAGDTDAFPPGSVDDPNNITQPSSDPYITQVGGTTLTTSAAGGVYESETVWNWGYDVDAGEYVGSCGGVSSYYSIPTWQMDVNSFATNGGSTSYRNIPDVALTADNVYVLCGNGTNEEVGGTSCAAPLWAGFTALVNEQAATNAQPPVGFLNPAIYELASETRYNAVFNDVTNGNNTSSSSPNAFYAVPGYDLCTGLGSPGGTNLINALLNPDPLIVVSNFGFTATNPGDGVFTPSTQTFYLTNVSAAPLTWSLVNTSAWLSASLAGDTLAAGASESVVVSLSSAATNLSIGTYAATLWFSNVITSVGHARLFTVSVNDPLVILSTNNFVFSGTPGGPFTPATQTLSLANLGDNSLNWSLGNTSVWFNFSPSNGTLAAGAQISVTVTPTLAALNVTAPEYPATAGNYPAMFVLTNLTSQVVQPASGVVQVTLVLNGGFETGDFTDWTLNGDAYPIDFVDDGSYSGIFPYEGGYEALLGEAGFQADISQTVPTVANQEYLLSLWLYNPLDGSSDNPNEFSVAWNGVTIYDAVNLPAFAWSNLQFVVTATGANTVLQLGGRDDNDYLALDDVSLALGFAPGVTLQPVSAAVWPGSNVVFTATATGSAPLAYQWLENGTNLLNSVGISGANTNQLVFTAATAAADGNYSLMVTNLFGVSTSSVATLTVGVLVNVAATGSSSNSSSNFTLGFTGPAGYGYILETTTNLAGGDWLPVYTNAFGTNNTGQFTDGQSANFPIRFYRVQLVP